MLKTVNAGGLHLLFCDCVDVDPNGNLGRTMIVFDEDNVFHFVFFLTPPSIFSVVTDGNVSLRANVSVLR